MKTLTTLELIKDAAFFGGNIPNERLKECRDFFDNVIENAMQEYANKLLRLHDDVKPLKEIEAFITKLSNENNDRIIAMNDVECSEYVRTVLVCKYINTLETIKQLKELTAPVIGSVTTDKCLCELNAEGQDINGWCNKHHTDWL